MTDTVEEVAASPVAVPETPYVGLTSFTESDAPFFFGREKERRIIAANLTASRLTLLYGASGVGKSSLLRAGLQRDFRERAERDLADGRLPESIVAVFNKWRDDPVADLVDCIESSVRELLGERAPEPPPRRRRLDQWLADWIGRFDDEARKLAAERSLEPDEFRRTEFLIVLDQFEQYFLYHADEDGEGTFAVEFPRAVNREDLRVNFLISLREDTYARLDRFEGRILNLFDSNLRIEHLDREAARKAIEGPIEQYNAVQGPGPAPFSVEPELVEAVLDQVRTGSILLGVRGAGVVEGVEPEEIRVETPFLQLVMSRLWQEERARGSGTLRLATLNALGGAEQIVRAHLAEAMSALKPNERAVAARVFHQLVTPGGAKIVHTASDLAEYADVDEKTLLPILDELDSQRILRSIDPAPGETSPRFEIRHDVLGGAVLAWSAQYEERRRQRLLLLRVGGIVAVLGAIGLVALLLVKTLVLDPEDARAQSRKLAQQALVAFDPPDGIQQALRALRISPTSEAEEALRSLLVVPHPGAVLRGHLDKVLSAEFSRDGSQVVTAGTDGTARVWDARTGRQAALLQANKSGLKSAAFSPDGRLVVTAGDDRVARVWDAASGKQIAAATFSTPPIDTVFRPDGKTVVILGSDGSATVWRPGLAGRPTARLSRVGGLLPVGALSARGDLVLTVTDGIARIRNVRTGATRVVQLDLDPGRFVRAAALSAGGKLIVVVDDRGAVRVWDTATRKPVASLNNAAGLESASFSPDGSLLAAGGENGKAFVWDLSAPEKPPLVLGGHLGPVRSAAFSRDGTHVVTASEDGTARVWELNTVARQPAPVTFAISPQSAAGAAFSPDGSSVVTTTLDPTDRSWDAQIWNTTTMSVEHVLDGGRSRIDSVAFSPDGTLVVTGSDDGRASVWKVADEKPQTVLDTPSRSVLNAAFSSDGDRIVTAGDDGNAQIWSTSDAKRLAELRHEPGSLVSQAIFSPDGGRVATVSDGTVWLWDVGDGRAVLLMKLKPPAAKVMAASFRGDGERLATADDSGTATIWDVETGRPLATLPGRRPLKSVVYSEDGKFILTAGDDGKARVWEAESERALAVFHSDEAALVGAVFSPDNRTVLTTSARGTRMYLCRPCFPIDELIRGEGR